MMAKAILAAMVRAECMKKLNIANINIVLQISDASCNLTTQLGSRRLVTKFFMGGLIQ